MKNRVPVLCGKHHRPLICPSCEAEKAAQKALTARQRKVRAGEAKPQEPEATFPTLGVKPSPSAEREVDAAAEQERQARHGFFRY